MSQTRPPLPAPSLPPSALTGRIPRWMVLLLCLLLTATQADARPLAAASDGIVSGHVLNGSVNNQPIGGAQVDLHLFDAAGDRPVTSVRSDAGGGFRFTGVDTSPSLRYRVSTTFAGVPYASNAISFASGIEQTADVTVYATTEDGSAIRVDRFSILITSADAKKRLLTIVESYRVQNAGSSTYVGQVINGIRQTVQVPLFGGASMLIPEAGFSADDAVTTASGFALTSPVLPGPNIYIYSYQVPYRASRLDVSREIAYPTALVEVILPGSLQMSSPQLKTHATLQIGGHNFDAIQAENLTPGSPVRLDVSGLPLAGNQLLPLDSLSTQLLLVAIVVFTALATVIVARRPAPAPAEADERRRLVRQLARLEDRFEAGHMSRAAYTREREAALAPLRLLTMPKERSLDAPARTPAFSPREEATHQEDRAPGPARAISPTSSEPHTERPHRSAPDADAPLGKT